MAFTHPKSLLGAFYQEHLLDADEALARVHEYYRIREPSKGGASPETDEQRDFVRLWYVMTPPPDCPW